MTIKFYSAWFCPYAQRAWLTFLLHNIPFQYIESLLINDNKENDIAKAEYKKNPNLLKVNPKGLVPTLEIDCEYLNMIIAQHSTDENNKNKNNELIDMLDYLHTENNTWVKTESIDSMIFLNKFAEYHNQNNNIKNTDINCFIPDKSFIQDAHYFNQNICSTFYKVLMRPTQDEQKEAFDHFEKSISEFLDNIMTTHVEHQEKEKETLCCSFYKSTNGPNIVDFTVLPWLLRLPTLFHYRSNKELFTLFSTTTKEEEENNNEKQKLKLDSYIQKMSALDSVKKTMWQDEKSIIQVYERYADGTAQSQVGKAVRTGNNAHDI